MDSVESVSASDKEKNASVKEEPNSSAHSGIIDAEDAFVTIQTKDGKSSQKIPLYQFLEKVVGVKFEDNIQLDVSSFMHQDKDVGQQGNTDKLKTTVQTSASKNTPIENLEVTSEESLDEVVKCRGRGRPRKEKAEDEVGLEKSAKGQSSKLPTPKSKEMIVASQKPSTSIIIDGPRRSRRTPARNSRFKDDFVDSSTLWSKGSSSSWNTQLMTLALAAERHETKPNKQNCLNCKRNAAQGEASTCAKMPRLMNRNLKDKDKDTSDLSNKSAPIKQEALPTKEQEKIEFAKQGVKTSPLNDNVPSGQVLKRPLGEAFNIAVNESHDVLSDKVQGDNIEDIYNASYYVIMEPLLDASGQGLVIQKDGDGITFNVGEVTGQTEENSFSESYPQDRLFACDFCDSIFLSASSWLHHNSQVHGKSIGLHENSETLSKEIHPCPFCDEKFPYQFMLDNHLKKSQHNGNSSYQCMKCKSFFLSQKERDDHCLTHHATHSCHQCGNQFDSFVLLRRHLKHKCTKASDKDHNVSISDSFVECESNQQDIIDGLQVIVQNQEDTPAAKVLCDMCDSKFSTHSGLWHHKLEIHQQFYPPGFKEKLIDRLEKNESMIKSTIGLTLDTFGSKEDSRNKYFVVMQPKWSSLKSQMKVNMENNELKFTVLDDKSILGLDDAGSETTSHTALTNNSTKDEGFQKYVKFECSQCVKLFSLATEYRDHCSQVHGECFEVVRYMGAFQCSQCSDTFPCQFMLDAHIKQHNGKKPLPCTLCNLSFQSIQDRREHWKKSHPGIGCPNCGKMYASIKYLQKHISLNCQDHYPASKKYIESQKMQQNNSEIRDSEKKVEKKILKCHLCPKICSSIHCWRRHMSENHEGDGFSKLSNSCIICHKMIHGYKALEKHLLEDHAEESGLPIEEENAIVKEALKRSKVDIIDYRKAGRDQANIFQDDEGMYHCPECPKTHTDLKALMIHIKTHVNMQLECGVCKKTFKNPTLLKQHVMRHRTTAVYSCDICGKKFVTLQKLNKHNKVHHSKDNFVCELCGMSFTLNDYLLKHKRCHTNKRPHCCSVCGKTFRTKPELRVHVLIHTQETPYVCEHCGRGFTQKGNWRIHLAQHTGHKPHKCNQCDLSFALPSHLKRHLATHNQKVNYRCMWCDKECTQRKHMQMHVMRVHKEDFFQYEEQMKLETPVPIAPSQMKMYNRRIGKSGQVRKAYKTRAKKCSTTSTDIMKGVTKVETFEETGHSPENMSMETIIEPLVETVTTDLSSLTGQEIPQDGSLQILVSGDHQSYAKHNIAGSLLGDDSSNVEIVMGDNHEINIIINNGDQAIGNDLTVQESFEEGASAAVALPHFSDRSSAQLHGTLQQAVNALVGGSKVISGEEAMALDIESIAQGTDTYAIVYPS